MKHAEITPATRHSLAPSAVAMALLLVLAIGYFLVELNAPLNHDVAWLLDAGSRWMRGEQLYLDIIELNPPLIFYVYAGLTFGTFAKPVFIAAVIVAMAISSLWAARLKGPRWGLATFVILIASGAMDFGQRDHLAAIVAIPYLWANRAAPRERILIGVWGFLGFGLKPYLMLVPISATLARMLRDRSVKPLFSPENITIALLCVTYVAATVLFYPHFFTSMIPLARLVYFAYGAGFGGEPVTVPLLFLAAVTAVLAVRDREIWPEAGALIGAIASYLVQGRYWSYHLVPAIALTFLLLVLASRRRHQRRQFIVSLVMISLLATALFVRYRRQYEDLIPAGATAVLFLSPHVWSAYPAVVDRGVVHASRYPAIWTLPGAWRLLRDPAASQDDRRRAAAVMAQTRRNIVDDIVRNCPNPIFADIRRRKPYFGGPFDFIGFISGDPRFTGYRAGEKVGMYQVYHYTGRCPPRRAP